MTPRKPPQRETEQPLMGRIVELPPTQASAEKLFDLFDWLVELGRRKQAEARNDDHAA